MVSRQWWRHRKFQGILLSGLPWSACNRPGTPRERSSPGSKRPHPTGRLTPRRPPPRQGAHAQIRARASPATQCTPKLSARLSAPPATDGLYTRRLPHRALPCSRSSGRPKLPHRTIKAVRKTTSPTKASGFRSGLTGFTPSSGHHAFASTKYQGGRALNITPCLHKGRWQPTAQKELEGEKEQGQRDEFGDAEDQLLVGEFQVAGDKPLGGECVQHGAVHKRHERSCRAWQDGMHDNTPTSRVTPDRLHCLRREFRLPGYFQRYLCSGLTGITPSSGHHALATGKLSTPLHTLLEQDATSSRPGCRANISPLNPLAS